MLGVWLLSILLGSSSAHADCGAERHADLVQKELGGRIAKRGDDYVVTAEVNSRQVVVVVESIEVCFSNASAKVENKGTFREHEVREAVLRVVNSALKRAYTSCRAEDGSCHESVNEEAMLLPTDPGVITERFASLCSQVGGTDRTRQRDKFTLAKAYRTERETSVSEPYQVWLRGDKLVEYGRVELRECLDDDGQYRGPLYASRDGEPLAIANFRDNLIVGPVKVYLNGMLNYSGAYAYKDGYPQRSEGWRFYDDDTGEPLRYYTTDSEGRFITCNGDCHGKDLPSIPESSFPGHADEAFLNEMPAAAARGAERRAAEEAERQRLAAAREAERQARIARSREYSGIDAWDIAQTALRRRYRVTNLSGPLESDTWIRGDGYWVVQGWVQGPNSINLLLHQSFQVVCLPEPDGTWSIKWVTVSD